MKLLADLHVHSKYAMATSPRSDLESFSEWAKYKGIDLLGTGDFCHPLWFKELKAKLKETSGKGIYEYKKTKFILQNEISTIYYKNEKCKKIHHLIYAPSLEVVEQIIDALGKKGDLKSDGRPIFSISSPELVEIIMNISKDNEVAPAHCLLPTELIHTEKGLKEISKLKKGHKVITHRNRFQKVKEVLSRRYSGEIIHIKPWNFTLGLKTTPEHPYYAIKTKKACPSTKGICKPTCSKLKYCNKKHYEKYKKTWIQARNLEIGDIIIYPRFNGKIKNKRKMRISKTIGKKYKFRSKDNFLKPHWGRMDKIIPDIINLDPPIFRLFGYYLAEGSYNNRNAISFTFSIKEKEYVQDVKTLMEIYFGIKQPKERVKDGGIELIYYSKILSMFFVKLFYEEGKVKRAPFKSIPNWILDLPNNKTVELFKGWWFGDAGCTSSINLANQMKIILLRLGIVPSLYKITKEQQNKYKNIYKGRIIKANYDNFKLYQLSFFKDPFELLKLSAFKSKKTKMERRHGWIDNNYIYLPIRKIKKEKYGGKVYNLEIEEDNSYVTQFATVHNCFTPWFGVFGSKGGFDSLEECYEDQTKHIHALETGLSADPPMFWRISALDKYNLISNSDCHSPEKLGRELNELELESLSYENILEALRTKDKENKIIKTYEFYPEEGKYHVDGHRKCNIFLMPNESKKYNNICPVCGRPLTLGVLHRVDDLADREIGKKPINTVPYKHLVPLRQIIAKVLKKGENTKSVAEEYFKLIKYFGNEFKVLTASEEDLKLEGKTEITEAILKTQKENLTLIPGYDGVFGKIEFKENLLPKKPKRLKQDTLWDY